MPKYLIAIILLYSNSAYAEDRSGFDNSLRAAAIVSMVVDWRQTRWVTKNYDKGYYETNKYLGEHPTTEEVDRYFVALLLRHYLLNRYLPGEKWRITFNVYTFATHGSAAYHNYSIGVKLDF